MFTRGVHAEMAPQRNIDLQIRKRQVTTLQTVFHTIWVNGSLINSST